MLNRHLLRIKAFKSVFAYENCKEANYQLALEKIAEEASLDISDKKERTELQAYTKRLFDGMIGKSDVVAEDTDMAFKEVLDDGMRYYHNQSEKDLKSLEGALLSDVHNVRKGQFSVFSLLIDLAFQNRKIADERLDIKDALPESTVVTSVHLYQNRAIGRLKENEKSISENARNCILNVVDTAQIRDWYKGLLNQDALYRAYLNMETCAYEDDWNIVDHIVRQLIFKHEAINNYFDEKDINWTENKPIIRSLVLKTLKSIKDQADELSFAEISYNWEEDEQFVRKLFNSTIRRSEEVDIVIRKNLENWDINRIALTDKVILQTAICEMIEFPSIPVKVTINEYIEISKTYSTPKSKNFINGILDVISVKLMNEGVIRKSGRGLIDNK